MEPHYRPEIALDNCWLMSNLLTKNSVLEFSNRAIRVSRWFSYRDTWSYDYRDTNFGVSRQLLFLASSTSITNTSSTMDKDESLTAPLPTKKCTSYQKINIHPANLKKQRGKCQIQISFTIRLNWFYIITLFSYQPNLY